MKSNIHSRVVRYGDLVPCRTAFIDTHTPGSDKKENFAIIGGGVSESTDQVVHIRETPGFNIGAAGQPPGCTNSLHSHKTAEVFFVLSGRWRFFWGRHGTAGEVVLEYGDLFNIPTGIFRGFENIGSDYGMLMAILGGDDAGGGVVWAPQVIKDAQSHGLVLGENGALYDTTQGEELPSDVAPVPMLTQSDLTKYPEPSVAQIVPRYVARYWDMVALACDEPCKVIAEDGMIQDRPGFEVHLVNGKAPVLQEYRSDMHEVIMVLEGHWHITLFDEQTTLAPGDTVHIPPSTPRSYMPTTSSRSNLFRVRTTQDPAGATWNPH